MRDEFIWLGLYQVLLEKSVLLQLNDYLEPYANIIVMPLVSLLIWIILDVLFYYDIQIFLF